MLKISKLLNLKYMNIIVLLILITIKNIKLTIIITILLNNNEIKKNNILMYIYKKINL